MSVPNAKAVTAWGSENYFGLSRQRSATLVSPAEKIAESGQVCGGLLGKQRDFKVHSRSGGREDLFGSKGVLLRFLITHRVPTRHR